jgi:hypothetical protein
MKFLRLLPLNALVLSTIALVATLSTGLVQYQNYTSAFANEIKRVEQKHLLVAQNLSLALDRYLTDLSSLSDHFWTNFQNYPEWKEVAQDVGVLAVGVKSDGKYQINFLTDDDWTAATETSEDLGAFLEGGTEGIRFSGLMKIADRQVFGISRTIGGDRYFSLLPLDYVRTIQASIQFGDRGHSAMFDQNGLVLAHPSAKLQEAGADLSRLSVVQDMMNGLTGVAFFYSPPMLADMVAGFTALEKAGWGIMVPQPIMEIELGVLDDIQRGTILGGLALIAFILLGYVIAKRLTASLLRNIDDLEKISQGHDIPLGDRRDISRESTALSQTLATTAQQVRASRDRLSEALATARGNIKRQNAFIDRMNHEIRTPLNGIAGAGDLLDTTATEEDLLEYRDIILGSVADIVAILERQLELQDLVKEDENVLSAKPESL